MKTYFYTTEISDCYNKLCQHSNDIFGRECGFATSKPDKKTPNGWNKCVPRTIDYIQGYRSGTGNDDGTMFIGSCYKNQNEPRSNLEKKGNLK